MNDKRLEGLLNCNRGRRPRLVEGAVWAQQDANHGNGGADKGDCREGLGAARSKDRFKTRPSSSDADVAMPRRRKRKDKGRCKRRQ